MAESEKLGTTCIRAASCAVLNGRHCCCLWRCFYATLDKGTRSHNNVNVSNIATTEGKQKIIQH